MRTLFSKQRKYKNKKVEVEGRVFDSKREYKRFLDLWAMQSVGAIRDLECQPEFILQEGFKKNGVTFRPITYRADFRYIDCSTEMTVVEDVKGFETVEFKIKRKLFEKRYPELTLRIVK